MNDDMTAQINVFLLMCSYVLIKYSSVTFLLLKTSILSIQLSSGGIKSIHFLQRKIWSYTSICAFVEDICLCYFNLFLTSEFVFKKLHYPWCCAEISTNQSSARNAANDGIVSIRSPNGSKNSIYFAINLKYIAQNHSELCFIAFK